MNKENLLIIIFICVILTCGCGINKKRESIEVSIKPSDFVGTWSSVRPTIDVKQEATNTFNFLVHWGSSATEYTSWNYTCNFNDEKELMECSGEKSVVTEDDNGEEITQNDENLKAEFKIENNILKWNDLTEHSADDIEFSKD